MTTSWNNRRIKGERSVRWQREDAAPRLAAEVPELVSLSLQLRNCTEESALPGRSRTQHIIVERAAALFEVACVEPKCEGGGFDVTSEILHALRKRKETFEGTATCNGSVGQGYCRCTLVYVMKATYRPG